MTDCENRRVVKTNGNLDAHAASVANKVVPVCMSYAQRKQWMDAYIEAGGDWECADPAGKKRKDIKEQCPPGSLEVTVNDKTTGKPIEGAEVRVESLGNKTTGTDGLAAWKNLPPGTYNVSVKKAHYVPEPWSGIAQVASANKREVKTELQRKGLLWFSIYYAVPDDAFKKAAESWKLNLNLTPDCTSEKCYVSISVSSETDFKHAWNSIAAKATNENYEVVEGRMYTHASGGDANSGLEFRADANDSLADGDVPGETTLRKSEITSMVVLPWNTSAQLWLVGCNTGVERAGWSPAQEFANRQRITTWGTPGYAYFSEQFKTYDRFDSLFNDALYLRSYKRSDNVAEGEAETGLAMPEQMFTPE